MPKIILEDIPVRALVRGQQLVEQLVVVPVPSPRHCVITATQTEVVLARKLDTAGRQGGCVLADRGRAGGWWAHGSPSRPLRRDSPPAQGGISILGRAEAAAVVDVSVNMQRKLQQSMPIDKEGASDSVYRQSVGHSCYATETGMHSARCAEDGRFHSEALGQGS